MSMDKEWMNRVPSPFPAVVVTHLPPDGRTKGASVSQPNNSHRRSGVTTGAAGATFSSTDEITMMNYAQVQSKVAMTKNSERRLPPTPPPRGVTLRSPSMAATSSAVVVVHNNNSSGICNNVNHNNNNNNRVQQHQLTKTQQEQPHQPQQQQQQQQQIVKKEHGYMESRYVYSVNGILGSAAQASAAAAFFARASQKLNLASPHRRKRHGSSDGAESPVPVQQRFATDFSGLLRRSPPPPPAHLLRRLGTRENPGVGKVKVMLRVAGDPSSSAFLSVDKKRKQLTLQELQAADSLPSTVDQERRVGVSAPKMFAFDGLFTQENSQSDVAASVLSDIVTAVINGSDGCVFCFGHAQLGKTTTMVGSCDADSAGLIPTAIGWLFRGIAEQKTKTGARFSVRVSAVEVAGPTEVLRDLLAPHATESEESPGVYLRDDPLLGTQLQNQSELRAPTAEKAAFYLDAALSARTDSSSPDARFSHLLYTLHVYQYSVDRTPGRSGATSSSSSAVAGGRSRLHLLDLGSCSQGVRQHPSSAGPSGISNMMTLSALGNVLVALFNGQRHLPHREHKITQVLRECLGSLTCQAALVAHVAASSSYSETLSTVQMASRVHRMRRRRAKQYNNAGSGGSGSGGSGEESSRLGGLSRSSGGESSTGGSADPSSSEQSCDTVIYVGPIDDATDGEHPPVYLPSLNSGDNRCSMVRALRGSSVDHRHQNKHNIAGIVQLHPAVKKESSRSPQIHRKAAKCEVQQQQQQQQQSPSGSSVATTTKTTNEEQWIDGPRFHKSRVSVASRMQVTRHPQREMWVDGPAQSCPTTMAPTAASTPSAPLAYGFMDHHKQGMIRQWVETQSAQRHPAGRSSAQMWIDAQPRPAPEPGTPVKVLTVFKTCQDEDEADQEESMVAAAADNNINRSPRLNRQVMKQSRSRRTVDVFPSEEALVAQIQPVATVAPMPMPGPQEPVAPQVDVVKKESEEKQIELPVSTPVKTKTAVTLTLDQLYSQCEQLAESLDQEDEDQSTEQGDVMADAEILSTDDQASDDLSAALDVTSEQVSISCDSWRRVRHHQTIEEEEDSDSVSVGEVGRETRNLNLRFRVGAPMNGRGGDYSPEYIEVEEPDEPVPTQDSCLQVTEEDIALSMMHAMNGMKEDNDSDSQLSGEYDRCEHPLRALSQDNLTVISHFTGETYSQGTASDWEPINSVFDPVTGALHPDFFQTQLDQLAKLHQNMYRPTSVDGGGGGAGPSSSTPSGTLQPTPLSALTNNIGSFKDLPLLSQDWSSVAVRNSPGRSSVTAKGQGDGARNALHHTSTIGMELERELGIRERELDAQLSSLRHPDGASDPHLDKHLTKTYECSRPSAENPQERLPGNGASTPEVEETKPVKLISAPAVTAAAAPLVPLIERPVVPDGNEHQMGADGSKTTVAVEVAKPHKTPKLSRFFGKNKQRDSASPTTVVNKRNTATSMSASPALSPKCSRSSPKPEKSSRSKSRESKHNSPAKSRSKSPSRVLDTPPLATSSIPPSPKSQAGSKSGSKSKSSSSHNKSPKKELKSSRVDVRLSSSKRDVKSYGFSYESCHQQTAPSSLCPSEGYESGGSDSGVHLNTVSPKSSKISSSRRHSSRQAQQVQGQRQRPHLMPIGEMGRKTFSSSGTSTSGSGGSAGHYESSGYESVMRDSECSSLDSSQESDRGAAEITALSPHHTVQAVLSGPCHKPPAAIGQSSSCTIL